MISERLDRSFEQYKEEYESKALEVLRSGRYIMSEELSSFEKEFAEYNNAPYCIGVGSGLDSLWMTMRLLGVGKGDEVLVQSNAYIACVMGITINEATPVFVEPDEHFGIDVNKIEEKITGKTKAILVVHLYGMPCDMDKIVAIAQKYHLLLIEDCAQAHGAKYKGKMVGTFGDAGCFSFYPTKNLGAFGDGGAIITPNKKLANQLRIFRNYGSEKKYHYSIVGANSRLDELQAGLLRVKLSHLNEINNERRICAKRYTEGIRNPDIVLPSPLKDSECIWHQYVIQCNQRDKLMEYLENHDIKTLIHYPIPPHLSNAYQSLGYKEGDFLISEKLAKTVLSLPIYNGMTIEEQNRVIDCLNHFR